MANLQFDESLVLILDEPESYSQVEEKLAEHLLELGYVNETYPKAIATREASFPTGLFVDGVNVAMPHCDVEHVKKGAICVGVLKKPVAWRRMDSFEETCPVSLVIMLALNEAHAHLEMLQKVVALVQNQDLVERIVSSDDAQSAYELLRESLS